VCNARESILAIQINSGSSKVIDFGTNRKRICDFLLVINSNLGPILHRFGDTVVYWSKNRQFVPTCLRNRPRLGWPLSNFLMKQTFLETRMVWLSDGEEIMTLAFFFLIQYRSVTDRRTDRQTDIPPLAIPAVCIARYANALVKTGFVQKIWRKLVKPATNNNNHQFVQRAIS